MWSMHHRQVVPSPIFNHCLKVNIDGYTELQLVPKHLLQVSVRELHGLGPAQDVHFSTRALI